MESQWVKRDMSMIMVAFEMSQEEVQSEEARSKRPGVSEAEKSEKQQAKSHDGATQKL